MPKTRSGSNSSLFRRPLGLGQLYILPFTCICSVDKWGILSAVNHFIPRTEIYDWVPFQMYMNVCCCFFFLLLFFFLFLFFFFFFFTFGRTSIPCPLYVCLNFGSLSWTTLFLWQKMTHDTTKPTKWLCAQRRLRSAWASAQSDQSSMSTWRKLGCLATHWAHSEELAQTGQMPRLIWVFAGRTLNLLVLLCRGSDNVVFSIFVLFYCQSLNQPRFNHALR